MTFLRLHVVRAGLLASLLTAAALVSLGAQARGAQAPAPAAQAAQVPAGRDASAASVASFALTQQMPVDPDVALGTLPNGLRYYVRPNPRPARRVELRLVVKAGSVLEDADQQGLAHFVEHMLFEGTRNFPEQGINEFLAQLGQGIGADANAQTSYDDTQYMLRVPSDSTVVLDRALLVLKDWANAATFEPSAIERQRGIVLSEWRQSLGAGERTRDKIRRVQLENSQYANRSPIGDPDILRKAQREQLVRFYRDWYRPDLMAVIVVGDVNRDAVVAKIKTQFSSLTNPVPTRPRSNFDVPERPATRYTIIADKETTATSVSVSNLRPARPQDTVGGYRQIMMDQLFGEMLDGRLDELTQRENPPFLRAGAQRALFPAPRTKDEVQVIALTSNSGVTRGLDALITEMERVTQFGFTATELTRAKQARLLSYERSVTESPDRESESRADEYTRNFLQSEALPTIWQELAFHRRFLPTITLQEMNALSGQWFPERNRLVIVSAPEAAGVALPSEMQLAAAVKTATGRRVEAYVDVDAGQSLMDMKPKPGTIVKTTPRPGGVTEWTLSNGATVVLKPTTLKEDQILFRASAPGGTSLASDADFVSARAADDVIGAGGVGRFNDATLNRMLAGKALAVVPYFGELVEGLNGGSTPQDLESMFQLLYLQFTQPRADPAAFAALVSQRKGLLANQMASPDIVFSRTLSSTLSRDHLRRQGETPETVDQWDLTKAMTFYKARFADASHFTFVFVGSFTVDMIKPYVETYVASLPASKTGETWRDLGITTPAGVVQKTVEKGIAPKSQVSIVFSGPFVYNDANLLALRTMTMVLQGRLFDAIRQQLGGTYSIEVEPLTQKFPRPEYSVRITWACDPARVETLVQRVFEEIAFVRKTPVQFLQMDRIRAALRRDYDEDSQNNGYLLNQIMRRYEDGNPDLVGNVFNVPDQIGALNGGAIQEAAQTYLNMDRYVRVTLMPESK
jgi:zinc protease